MVCAGPGLCGVLSGIPQTPKKSLCNQNRTPTWGLFSKSHVSPEKNLSDLGGWAQLRGPTCRPGDGLSLSLLQTRVQIQAPTFDPPPPTPQKKYGGGGRAQNRKIRWGIF